MIETYMVVLSDWKCVQEERECQSNWKKNGPRNIWKFLKNPLKNWWSTTLSRPRCHHRHCCCRWTPFLLLVVSWHQLHPWCHIMKATGEMNFVFGPREKYLSLVSTPSPNELLVMVSREISSNLQRCLDSDQRPSFAGEVQDCLEINFAS